MAKFDLSSLNTDLKKTTKKTSTTSKGFDLSSLTPQLKPTGDYKPYVAPTTKVASKPTTISPLLQNIPQRVAEVPQSKFVAPKSVRGYSIPSYASSEKLLADNPIKAGVQKGFADAFGMTGRVGTIGENITKQEEKAPDTFKKASYAGRIGGELTSYITAGKIAKSIPALQKLGTAGKLGGRLAIDQVIDNIAQAPRGVLKDISEDKSIDEITKNLIKQNVIDLAFNVTIAGAGGIFNKLKNTAKSTGQSIEEVAETVIKNPTNRKSIQQELGLPDNFTAKDMLDQQNKLAKEIGAENYYKSTEQTPQQINADFQTWRSKNFGGSTGQLSPGDMSATKELYKETTGIDVDALLKETLDNQANKLKLSDRLASEIPKVEPSLQDGPFNISSLRNIEPVQPQKIASTVEQPTLAMDLPKTPKQTKVITSDLPPIDTKSRVLTETPKKLKTPLSDTTERVYQELVSKNIPFEKIGGKSNVQASNLNRVAGTIEYNVIGKQIDKEGKEIGKSIADIFSDVPKEEKQELFDYALNTHNIDRFREGKPVFGDTVNDVVSANIKQNYDVNKPQFAEKQKEITNYFSNLMNEWAVKSGLTTPETAKMLAERYPNYIPTYRAKDLPKSMISGNQNISQIIKKAKGGEDFILPLDQQMIAMTERTVKNARKNELMNTLNDLYESSPESVGRYIKEVRGGEKEVVEDILDIGRNFDVEPVVKGNEYIVNFYKDGEPRQMVINRSLYKALETAGSDNTINQIGNVVKKYATNPFKNLITGYNPIFAASNIMRDVPTALTYSNNPLKMVENVPEAVKEMMTNGENFKLFKAMGGTREGLIGAGKEFKVPNLNEASKAFTNAQKLNPIKAIGDVNNFTETLPRFSEFLAVLKETGDPALAVYKSAELTTDFSRHGNLTKLVDSFVPYLNPSVQGIDKFARSMKNNPIKTAVKGSAFITVPTVILDQINKDNEAYNNLSPRERNLYFQVPIPNSDKFLRIPKSRELGVLFSSLAEWSARAKRGQEVTGKEIAETIKENFTPVDISSSAIWTPAIKTFRQIKDPGSYQTNYFDGLIVPESQRRYSPGEQYDLNSSGIAKAIGQKFEVSPYVIDYFLKSYGGIVSQIIQPVGRDRKQSILQPLSSKFITDPVYKSSSINDFYDKLEEKKQAAQDYNKRNNIDSKIVTELEKEANAMTKISKQLSDIRKEQKTLQVQKGNEDKLRKLQKAMNDLAAKTLKEVK